MTHEIRARITPTSVEFRNFPQDCGWFDPADDIAFFPLTLGLKPIGMSEGLEFILLDANGNERYDRHWNSTYYGLRWDLQPWGKKGKHLALALIEDIRDRFGDENVMIVLET